MYPRLFLAILPVLLGTFAPSLALPVQSSDTLSIARPFDLSSHTTPLLSRDVDTELLGERGYEDDESDVLSRAINEDHFPLANRPKRTATEAKQHKEGVRAGVSTSQADNAAKKFNLEAETAKLPGDHRYGKPRKPKYTTVTTKKGTKHVTGGYRKENREKGFRLAKQPKTPKANFAKGEHKTNAKAVQKQTEAKARLQAKKAAGRIAHATANTRYAETLAHGNMPNRNDEYHVPNHSFFPSEDVRTGAHNLGMQDGPGPVSFRNDKPGPHNNRHLPLVHMDGTSDEYPINKRGFLGPPKPQVFFTEFPNFKLEGGYSMHGHVNEEATLPKPPSPIIIPTGKPALVPPKGNAGHK